MQIISPLAYGNGAYILHKALESNISGYQVKSYNPWVTLFPPLISLINSKNADIIHVPVDYACFSEKKDVPLISTVHGYMLDDEVNNSLGFIRHVHYKTDLKYFFKKSLSISKNVVCVSHYLKNRINNNLNYQGNIEVIHNGIDINQFKPSATDKSENKITLLFVGNLRKAKGIHMLSTMLDILGDRYELLYTSGLRKSHAVIKHKNARCVGSIPHNKISELYNSADILISASIREGFGLAIAESMACGLPVVAANNSAVPELIDDGKSGYLCDDIKPTLYADKILQLGESKEERLRMGKYNREKIVDNYNMDKMVNMYKDVFEKTLSF